MSDLNPLSKFFVETIAVEKVAAGTYKGAIHAQQPNNHLDDFIFCLFAGITPPSTNCSINCSNSMLL